MDNSDFMCFACLYVDIETPIGVMLLKTSVSFYYEDISELS